MKSIIAFAAIQVVWVVLVVRGWSWEAFVPLAVWLAWLAGELYGEGRAWARDLERRAERSRRVLDIAKILRDPGFTQVVDGTKAEALRDRATWN